MELSQLKIELYIYIPKLKLSVQSLHCCVTFLHMCLHHVNKVHLSFMLTTKELHIAAYSDRHEKVQVKDRRGVWGSTSAQGYQWCYHSQVIKHLMSSFLTFLFNTLSLSLSLSSSFSLRLLNSIWLTYETIFIVTYIWCQCYFFFFSFDISTVCKYVSIVILVILTVWMIFVCYQCRNILLRVVQFKNNLLLLLLD